MPDRRPSLPTLFDPTPYDAAGAPPAPPRTEVEAIERYLGCSVARVREVEEAEALARALVHVHGLADWEALHLLLDDCVPGWIAAPDRLLLVLLAMARLGATMVGAAALALRESPSAVLARDAQRCAERHERALDALEAIADGVDTEARDDEVVALCDEMLGEVAVLAAVDGIAVDRAEMLDLELRALLESGADAGEPSAGSH